MKKLSKRIVAVLSAFVLILSFAAVGCNKNETTTTVITSMMELMISCLMAKLVKIKMTKVDQVGRILDRAVVEIYF